MLQLFTEHNSSTESNEIGITTSNVSASMAPYFPSLSTINFCNGCIGVKMQSNSSLPFNGAYPCINLTFPFFVILITSWSLYLLLLSDSILS